MRPFNTAAADKAAREGKAALEAFKTRNLRADGSGLDWQDTAEDKADIAKIKEWIRAYPADRLFGSKIDQQIIRAFAR